MSSLRRMVVAALFVALGIVLPFVFHSVPNAGRVFLPMHIPILMCGLVCGIPYGLICGIITPLLSCLLTGMPPVAMLPSMLCELAAYGISSSLFMRYLSMKSAYAKLYVSLIGAMLFGRVLYGVLNSLIFSAGNYSLQLWLASAFVTAIPGIAIQVVLIPAVVFALQKANLVELGAV